MCNALVCLILLLMQMSKKIIKYKIVGGRADVKQFSEANC